MMKHNKHDHVKWMREWDKNEAKKKAAHQTDSTDHQYNNNTSNKNHIKKETHKN